MNATPLDHAAYCTAVDDRIAALAELLDSADLDRAVPTTPGWDVQGVAKHVGVIHRWAAQMVRDGLQDRLDFKLIEGRAPDDGQTWADWVRAGGAYLVGQLRDHAPATPVWTWGPGGTVGWWARRMTYETFVHGADVALAVGVAPTLAPDLAIDGIDEFLENLPGAASFAPAVAELRGEGETIHLHATDADGEWMITLTADGFTVDHGHGKGDVAVRGPATDLLLLVYGRRAVGDAGIEVFGDLACYERWRALTAI
ncbi:MAG: maleylpyruvate isomerase family mycothiol-dependent enzyme [Actinobacteria bacterium]|nr:maleylpyruvate isomerase family mycothiol-dependent enzyme [Actinomycetota bacterium]